MACKPSLSFVNRNLEDKISVDEFVAIINQASSHWVIDRLFQENSIEKINRIVQWLPITHEDIARCYPVSSFKSTRLDRLMKRVNRVRETKTTLSAR